MTQIIMTRKAAFKLAWRIFWFATGTSRVGIETHTDEVELVGTDLIEED